MSYILDALKKSEQERGHGNIPDVQTVHSSSLNYRQEKRSYWPYILISAVLLNLAAIVYYIFDREKNTGQPVAVATDIDNQSAAETAPPQPAATAPAAIAALPANNPVNDTTVETPVAPETPPVEKTGAAEKTAGNKLTKSPEKTTYIEPQQASQEIIDFHDLPESIRRQLPAIVVSAHVYSSNPQQRSIVINNNFMEEGEYLLDGLVLYEITPEGAIFSYESILFRYNVVPGWQ